MKNLGKKAIVLASIIGMLGFSNAVADTKGERVEGSRPIESVDSIILENAAKSKTLFFGESHWLSEDSDYVMHILPKLKELGFSYLGLEAKVDITETVCLHTQDLLKFIQDYKKKVPLDLNDYRSALPGWIALTKAALDLGLEIVFFDVYADEVGGYGTPRDTAMLNNLKERIFDKDPDAKAIIYCGVWHCSEQPIHEPYTRKKEETLSYLLESYTEGRNYSVALIYTPIFEEMILKEGKINIYGPPTTNKTSGKLSHLYDLDLSNHPLLEPYCEEFTDKGSYP